MKLADIGKAITSTVRRIEEAVTHATKPEGPRPSAPAFEQSGYDAARDLTALGAPLPPASGGSAPTMRASGVNLQNELKGLDLRQETGGRIPFADGAKAEAAVRRNNAARTHNWSMEQIRNDPNGFLRNVTQIDGLNQTTSDRSACGPAAMLMGMIAARPDSVRELAGKLVDANGNPTADCVRLMGRADANAPMMKEALTRIRDGNFSARDVTFMAEGLRDGMGGGGASSTGLISLRNQISGLGVPVPRMELQNFGHPDGSQGHWRVYVNGQQYNPWPDEQGHSGRMGQVGSLTAGSADGPGWQCREKIFMDDNQSTVNAYSVPGGGGRHWEVQNDPPLIASRYERQADGSMRRANTEPGRLIQLTDGRLTTNDLDTVAPRSIP